MGGWILCGLFGGAAPSLINLAGHLTTSYSGTPFPALGYWVGVAIYACVGLLAAAYFANRTPGEAIKAGIVAPALFLSFLNGSAPPESHATASLFGVGEAYAQDAGAILNGGAETKNLFFSWDRSSGTGGLDAPFAFQFMAADGSTKTVKLNPDETTPISIPEGVQAGKIVSGDLSKEFNLPKGDAIIGVEVQATKTSFGQQLFWALSGKLNTSPSQIGIDVKSLGQ